ncbi:MAG: aminotransferase class III-fold pyridoxal phosphate-dependent enzyme [Solirubrobacteraceae bacterium]
MRARRTGETSERTTQSAGVSRTGPRGRAVACRRGPACRPAHPRYGGELGRRGRGEGVGSFVETVDGQRVLDFTAGQICATVGHNHPRVVAAIEAACREVLHLNSWMLTSSGRAGRDRCSLAEPTATAIPEPDQRRPDRTHPARRGRPFAETRTSRAAGR